MKKKMIIAIFIVIFSCGLAIMLYPVITSFVSEKTQIRAIEEYNSEIEQSDIEKESLLRRAVEYNKTITGTDLADAFTTTSHSVSSNYYNMLKLGKLDIMGYISIPKIDLQLPIYHGTSASTLQKGVGHLESSSLPVGGEDTHAVLTAHRGLPSAKLFTDLDQLTEGDVFYLTILGETLAYQVDQIKVVEPTNVEDLKIVSGEDYVTLATCTPYAINTHRLLVRGRRIDYQSEMKEETEITESSSLWPLYLIFSVVLLVIFILILLFLHLKKKKEKEKENIIQRDEEGVEIL